MTAEGSGMRHIGFYRILMVLAFVSVLARRVDAGLMLELTTDGVTPGNGKLLTLTNADIGNAITLDIWARVTGLDASASNDGLQSVNLNFSSIGPTLGNLANLNMSAFFHDNGSQPGAQYGAAGDF